MQFMVFRGLAIYASWYSIWQLYHALQIQVYSKHVHNFLESYVYFWVAGSSDTDSSLVISRSLKGARVNWGRLMKQGIMGRRKGKERESLSFSPSHHHPLPPVHPSLIINETMRDDWGRVRFWQVLSYKCMSSSTTGNCENDLDFIWIILASKDKTGFFSEAKKWVTHLESHP